MLSAWEELYVLGDLEFKYPFFRLDTPKVEYVLNKDIFNLYVSYRLNLSAKNGEAYLRVDFRTPHNYMQLNSSTKSIKTRRMEAQEEIMCDPHLGYDSVLNFFKNNGAISRNNIDFIIKINDDVLKFDDHGLNHQCFRGWTGGYDPGYGGPDNINNIFSRKQKKKWDVKPYYVSLEKRINTMKMLFDGINSYAGFIVNQNIQPINKIPDFRRIYFDTTTSERFKFMEFLSEDIANKIGAKPNYDVTITISNNLPRITFFDDDSGVFFFTDYVCFNEEKICCELHIPKEKVKLVEFDRTYIQYNEEKSAFKGKDRDMIGAYQYVKSLDDIQLGLQTCLKRLGY
jgi:hypothetical protein